MVAKVIGWFSKCDFRNLGKIWGWHIFFWFVSKKFSRQKFSKITFSDFFLKKKFENFWIFGKFENSFFWKCNFFLQNVRFFKNPNFDFSKIKKFDFSKIKIFDFSKKTFSLKIYFLSRIFFVLKQKCLKEKIYFFEKNICQPQISPRFRKSHLENRAIIFANVARSKRAKLVQDS